MNLIDLPHLIVEGDADEHAITHLLMQHGLFAHAAHGRKIDPQSLPNVNVVVSYPDGSGGKEKLLNGIHARISLQPPSSPIGFVVDADDPEFTDWSLQKTWDSVRTRLQQKPANIETPAVPPSDGFIGFHRETGVAVGVWLMPDNSRDGAIEDFLMALRGSGTLAAHAEASTIAAREQHGAPFEEKDTRKAELATWLAWQDPPGQSYGLAFKRHSLQHDSETALSFVSWVRRLLSARPGSPS